jgi:DNA-binding MarR family transcriptional regulator
VDSATLTGVLDRLEGLGYLDRRKNPRDRRAILIALTEAGHEIAQRIGTILIEGNREFLSRLDPEEAKQLRRLLCKIRR